MISELELDRAFANKLASSQNFCHWILEQAKFKSSSKDAFLLNKEQANAKPRKKPENWWRHWWCGIEDGSQSETDIFVTFGFANSEKRIALHIEDKPPHGKFTPNQYLNYRKRAMFMAQKAEYMNYSEFRTVLLAPLSFIEKNADEVKHFDCIITYESLSKIIPEFRLSLEQFNQRKPSKF